MSLFEKFQSNLRKQIRKLPKNMKSVKIIHYYSLLFIRVLCNLLSHLGPIFADFHWDFRIFADLQWFQNFHRIQNFRQFSNLFSQNRLKKRNTSLFSGICREIRTNFHQTFSEKCKIRHKKKKNWKFVFSFAKKCWWFLAEILRSERCKSMRIL